MRRLIAFLPVLVISIGTAEASDRSEGLKIFSKIDFISSEGEFYGLQIVVIPYGYGRTKVLWRSATGALDEPLLLEAKVVGNQLTVTVPKDNDDHGEWVLTIKGDKMDAAGQRDHFILTRIRTQ